MPIPVLPPSSSGTPIPAGQPTVAERTPSLEVRATWRPERYTRLANGTFETDVAGWSVAGGINAAGTSVTRMTTDARSGSACGRIVIPATVDAGANHDLGSQRWYADTGHSTLVVVKLWLKRESGGRSVRVTIGSEGTVTARASIEVELLDEWQEYILTWRPQASVTDAQLAIMSADGRAVTVLVDDVLVYSPLASQVDDGSFLTGTTGWMTDGSLIASAATSLTRIPSDGMVDGSAELVTPASAGAGTDIALGSRLFGADMTHRLQIALRAIAGGDQVRLRLGSIGTSADRADATVTATSTWTWHTLDWTPSADRTDVAVSVSAGAAAAMTVRLSEVEVYEALDELRPDSWEIVRGAAFDGTDVPGTMGGALPDPDGTYTPWHTGSPLFGAVKAMVPIMARATHGGRAHGLGWGRLTTVAPDPYGEHAHLTTSDGLRDLVAERISRPFRSDLAYAEAQDAALTAAGVGHWQRDLDGAGPESGTFFDGTDTEVPALSYLTDLCSATGSVHVAVPSAHANVGWVYRTLNRARLTDATIDWTITDDSRGPLPGAEMRDETLITAARRGWQGYELVRPPGPHDTLDLPWGSEALPLAGGGIVAIGGDRAAYPDLLPYLTFTRPEYGSFEPPEPEVIVTVRRVRGKRKRKRRVRWTDRLFPLTVAAGESQTLEVEFSLMMEGLEARWTPGTVDVSLMAEPARAVITISAGDSDVTIDALALIGRPWLPTTEGETILTGAAAGIGSREPVTVPGSDTYVSGPGAAEGVVRYILWRYGESRLRPVVRDALQPQRMLGIGVGDRVSMSQTRYRLPATRFAVRSIRQIIARPGNVDWHTEYTLEELPTDAGPWVIVDGGAAAGIDSGRRVAY